MAEVEEVRAQISEMLRTIRIEGCLPTVRSALLFWREYLTQTQPYGLSVADKRGYEDEHKRLVFLLTEVFPEEEHGQAD
jgi:hypothetical protein